MAIEPKPPEEPLSEEERRTREVMVEFREMLEQAKRTRRQRLTFVVGSFAVMLALLPALVLYIALLVHYAQEVI
jgi:hypothetical protein